MRNRKAVLEEARNCTELAEIHMANFGRDGWQDQRYAAERYRIRVDALMWVVEGNDE